MRLLLIPLALFALAGCSKEQAQPPANEVAPTAVAGPVKGVDRSHKGQPAPDVTFNDPDGGEISLAEFKGVPTLVNLWATWCAPCVKELPTLDQLSQSQAKDGSLNDDPNKMGGFYTALQYGVFFPLGGLEYLKGQQTSVISDWSLSTAQTVRLILGVLF